MISSDVLREGLPRTLAETDFPDLGTKYVGKVRDNYTKHGMRYIVTTDRISAFDQNLGTIPFKGQVLTRLAAWWFDRSSKVVDNHFVRMLDPNVLETIECKPLMVEMVVRSYLTGNTSTSILTHYMAGGRNFCGHVLPDGMKPNQKLDHPIVTPTTKAPKGSHDVSCSREEILATGCVTEDQFDRAAEMALRLFDFGSRVCASRGIILVDTKYEFGMTSDGTILVIDEIHTPDSSRFWHSDTYLDHVKNGLDPEPFDKDYVRRYLKSVGYSGDGPPPVLPEEIRIGAAQRYIEACEAIMGGFAPNLEDPNKRILDRLKYNGIL